MNKQLMPSSTTQKHQLAESKTHSQDIDLSTIKRREPHQVLRLQQTVGNQATRNIIQSSRYPTITRTTDMLSRYKMIHRRELDANEILTQLETIDFVQDKLAQSLRSGRKSAKTNQDVDIDGETKNVSVYQYKDARERIRRHVERSLTNFEDNILSDNADKNQAIMMAIVLDSVARVVADELHEPALKPKLAQKFMELYRGDIEQALPTDMTNKNTALDIASQLISDDPVSLYMHDEMRLDKARESIHKMAGNLAMTPAEVFDMLSQKWQAEIAAYSKNQIAQEEDEATAYNIKESTGELSVRYFEELFGTGVDNATITNGELDLNDNSQDKLDALEDEVSNPTATAMGMSGGWGITQKQDQHLREVEEADQSVDKGGVRDHIANYISGTLGFTQQQAQDMLPKIERWLQNAPLTITVHGHHWFGKAPQSKSGLKGLLGGKKYQPPTGDDAKFRPATAFTVDKDYSEIFDKEDADGSLTHTGEYTHPTYKHERGAEYMRFRMWKDRLMTNNLDFTPEEMPTFGALSPILNSSGNSTYTGDEIGKNYYGNVHFKLKNASVKSRLVYTATDHGQPHRDPLLALADFLGGDSLTKLKPSINNSNIMVEIINAVLGNKAPIGDLPFEVQIFGEVDVTNDVEKIYVAPSTEDNVKKTIKAFGKQNNIEIEIVTPPDNVEIALLNRFELLDPIKEQLATGALDLTE